MTTLLGVPTMFAAWADVPDGRRHGAARAGRGPSGHLGRGRARRRCGGAVRAPLRHRDLAGLRAHRGGAGGVDVARARGETDRARSVGPCRAWRCGWSTRRTSRCSKAIPGEIWVRGANVFAGYWRDPDGHRRRCCTDDGWLRTGRHRRDRRGRRPLRRRPVQGSRHRVGVQRVPRRGRAGGGVGARCGRGGGDRPARRRPPARPSRP